MFEFSIEKIGYSKGIYGNTGEYYRINGVPSLPCVRFVSMFGGEYRVAEAIKLKGGKEIGVRSDSWGFQRKGEHRKWFLTESEIIKDISAM